MKQRWPGFLLIAVILVIWEISSYYRLVDPVSFPRVSLIFTRWIEILQSGVLIEEVVSSLGRIFTGFALAAIVAIPLGLLMGGFTLVYRLMEPITEFLRRFQARPTSRSPFSFSESATR
jgi:ABC-type nitrate/sulfonate/bicarbonate transport system permease component